MGKHRIKITITDPPELIICECKRCFLRWEDKVKQRICEFCAQLTEEQFLDKKSRLERILTIMDSTSACHLPEIMRMVWSEIYHPLVQLPISSHWTKVTDQRPPYLEMVLFWNGSEVWPGWDECTPPEDMGIICADPSFCSDSKEATHWMLLPQGPA